MPIHDKIIEKIASQMYEPKLPYHNFSHAVTVTRHSEAIIERCKKENAPLDETVVYYALIIQDVLEKNLRVVEEPRYK
jgi:hypothetical protein